MYIDFSDWNSYEGFACGSGTSAQEWIVYGNPEQVALFKERKSDLTTDNFSEKISSELSYSIGLKCAKIDLAIRNGKVGMVSYKINLQEETIIEGIQYISKSYPNYNTTTLIDEDTGERYSLEMILNSIKELNLEEEIFKIFIFDFIIGNSDRHHSNWAILKNNKDIKVCPIYDNASSLCSYVTDEQIKRFMNDSNWVNSLIDSKSKTLIRLNGKKVKHSDFIRYLKDKYYDKTIDFVLTIKEKLTDECIDNIIDSYKGSLSNEKISILKIYIKRKVELLSEIYEVS